MEVKILPNPVKDQLQVSVLSTQNGPASVSIMDANSRIIFRFKENLLKGSNTILYPQVINLSEGTYFLRIEIDGVYLISKFNKLK